MWKNTVFACLVGGTKCLSDYEVLRYDHDEDCVSGCTEENSKIFQLLWTKKNVEERGKLPEAFINKKTHKLILKKASVSHFPLVVLP